MISAAVRVSRLLCSALPSTPCSIRAGVVLCIAVWSTTIATAGDFGRPRYYFEAEPRSFVIDGGPDAPQVELRAFPWTDDERALRKLADGIVLPLDSVGFWGNPKFVAPESAWDPTAYAAALLESPVHSSAARYARLTDHIRNDVQRWENFIPAWHVVADLDGKRLRSMRYVSYISPEELAAVDQRVTENQGVFVAAKAALHGRIASYRFAMERLVIAQPSPMAIETERALRDLERRLGANVPVLARGRDPGASIRVPLVRK